MKLFIKAAPSNAEWYPSAGDDSGQHHAMPPAAEPHTPAEIMSVPLSRGLLAYRNLAEIVDKATDQERAAMAVAINARLTPSRKRGMLLPWVAETLPDRPHVRWTTQRMGESTLTVADGQLVGYHPTGHPGDDLAALVALFAANTSIFAEVEVEDGAA